jgi:hypothetical protein
MLSGGSFWQENSGGASFSTRVFIGAVVAINSSANLLTFEKSTGEQAPTIRIA